MAFRSFLLFIAAAAVVHASPAPSLCPIVTALVSKAGQQSSATAFCSSYLSISAKTTTVTTTTTATATASPVTTTYTTVVTTAAPSTVVVTTSTTSTTTSTSTAVATSTVTSTIGIGCVAPTTPGSRKRAAAAKPKPSALNSYAAGAILSSACSCLSIPTPTSTLISTVSKTATVTPTSSVASTTTTTPITSSTTTITSIVTASTVTTSTTTLTATTTNSQFSIVASGGAVNGQYALAQTGEDANVYFNTDAADATLWELDSNGDLIEETGSVGFIANEDASNVDYYKVYLNSEAVIQANGFVYLQCTYTTNSDGTCPLTCSANGGSISSEDGTGAWYVSPAGNAQSDIFTPYAVAAST